MDSLRNQRRTLISDIMLYHHIRSIRLDKRHIIRFTAAPSLTSRLRRQALGRLFLDAENFPDLPSNSTGIPALAGDTDSAPVNTGCVFARASLPVTARADELPQSLSTSSSRATDPVFDADRPVSRSA